MATIEREPTHLVRLRESYPMVVADIETATDPSVGVPCQLTDRLARDWRNAQVALAKAEADIRKWLERTDQTEVLEALVPPW